MTRTSWLFWSAVFELYRVQKKALLHGIYSQAWVPQRMDRCVASDQHQWSHDQCHTHLCAVQTRADKELVISYAIVAHSLFWAACTCSHIQLQVYIVAEFTSLKPMVCYKWKADVRPCPVISGSGRTDRFPKVIFVSDIMYIFHISQIGPYPPIQRSSL